MKIAAGLTGQAQPLTLAGEDSLGPPVVGMGLPADRANLLEAINNLLLPVLAAGAPARVVTVSSGC